MIQTIKLPALLVAAALLAACFTPDAARTGADAGTLTHLTLRLDAASVKSAASPASAREERAWGFGGGRAGWRIVASEDAPILARAELATRDDALRLSLLPADAGRFPFRLAGLATELEGLRLGDWETVLVRARSSDRFAGITLAYNLEEESALPDPRRFFFSPDDIPPIFSDGSEQTYALPLRPREGDGPETELRSLAVFFGAPGPASVDVLSVTLVPRGAAYLDDAGTRAVTRGGTTRDTLFAHAPATIGFPVAVPAGGRLDVALAVGEGDRVTYRVSAGEGDLRRPLFEETIDDATVWHQRSVDLAALAGREVELVLEAASERAGTVALWGAPIVSGADASGRPNVVFYVIDGGDANLMSLYDYGRPTTPFLEALAKEGVLFTRAYANSTWTQPSTVSFMTSLHHSVLGGLRRGVHSTTVPAAAATMAEHFRRGGYQTVSLTANPNAGRLLGLERGVDFLRDVETEHHSTSSIELQETYWRFRDAYPGGPTWVHFQTTDVHEPHQPVEPYAGRFLAPEARERLAAWDQKLFQVAADAFGSTSVAGFYDTGLARAEIDRKAFYEGRRDLYDETMLHQDHALEEFVAELKRRGEWEKTILVVGADHGHPAGTFARFGRGLIDPEPEPWQGALFDPYLTRVPLLVIFPGAIEGGRRVDQPVAMIDVLPTLLELAGLPPPGGIIQGRSLAPLLRGEALDERPVVLDEFRVDSETGAMIGNIEIVDGRWGASLEIAPVRDGGDPRLGRHAVPAGGRWGAVHPYFPEVPRLLLYDLENDPFATRAVNEEHPDLVTRYGRLLREYWDAHQVLAERFRDAGETVLTPDQLEQLRTLGYIQ